MRKTVVKQTCCGLLAALLICIGATAFAQQSTGGARFLWADLITDRPEVSRDFYGALFGWSFRAYDGADDEQLISLNGAEIGVMVSVQREDAELPEAQWISVLVVDDADSSASAAKSRGGQIVTGPANNGVGSGRYAVIRDGQGALLTLYSGPTPALGSTAIGRWGWFDLFTTRPSSAELFLSAVAGFESAEAPGHDVTGYRLVGNGDKARAGIVPISGEIVDPAWIPYVVVKDVDATIAKAETLGAKIVARSGDAAILLDPALAPFGVISFNPEGRS